ncbi:MAG TPA: inactive serine/threonine-protein kinase VRK3, partial [Gemmatimonadaceae bacterium]|nr:inactive serine/threonine-protein kinase VRK3 [Gemmatimonadaceae bacterium]
MTIVPHAPPLDAMPLSNWFRRAPLAPPARTSSAKTCSDCQVALPEAARYCFICGQEVAPVAGEESPFSGHDDAVVATVQARLAHALGRSYRIRGVLGKGGMGIVFLADDLADEIQVAIKVLRPELSSDETGVARFRREAEIAASLEHPGI